MSGHLRSAFFVASLALGVADTAAKDTGRVFVSNEKSNTVSVLDGKTYAPVATIRTGKRPRDLKLNSERTRLYVACGDDNRIDVIDVVTLAVVDQIGGIDEPEVFDIAPDGRQLLRAGRSEARRSDQRVFR